MDFVAVDVETANSSRASICAFGLAVVADGQVIERHSWLSRPPESVDYFDPFFTSIHGITEADCANAPSFAESLDRALAIVDGRPVIAHNAAFDVGAIRDACVESDLPWPDMTYGCSVVLCRRGLDLVSNSLPVVCEHLRIDLTAHHDPGADAEAAARVVLALADRAGVDTLDDLATSLMVRMGQLNAFDWAGCVGRQQALTPPEANTEADPDHPLYGREIVFTGGLSIIRRDVWALVADVGAIPASGVTRRTNYLVIGDGFMGETPEEFHTGKAAKASKLRAKGVEIEALTEADLWTMLADTRTSGTRG